MTGTRIFEIYRHMKTRCYSPSNYHYKWYGARGIKICDEWLTDFMSFYKWSMEHGYANDLKIDRIDNNGNYEPSNCRWTTHKEQCNNRSNNFFIEVNGVTKTLAQWLEIYAYNDLNKNSVKRRYLKGIRGEALFAPIERKQEHHKIVQKTLDGKVIGVFDSGFDIQRKLGFNPVPIYNCCKKKKHYHTSYGFKWEYLK